MIGKHAVNEEHVDDHQRVGLRSAIASSIEPVENQRQRGIVTPYPVK